MSQAQPHAGGRPSKYDRQIGQAICAALADGQPLRTAVIEHGVGIRTVYAWLQEHQEFQQLYARARDDQADTLADDMLAVADNPDLDPNDKRVRVDTRKWIASKLKPKKYGDYSRHEVSGPDGGPIQAQQTDEQMIAQLVAVAGQNPMVKHKLLTALKAAVAALEA